MKLPTPPAVISARWSDLRDFARTHRDVYLKPLADMQGRGVVRLRTERGLERCLQRATQDFRKAVLLQARVPDGASEARWWFAGARFVAAVSLGSRGRAEPMRVSGTQRRMARTIGAALRRAAIDLAAVDLVGDLVVDLNFASPGLLVESERALGVNLAETIVKMLLRAPRERLPGGIR